MSEGLRVVAFGGGTGLPVLLRGLKDRVEDLTAVVTVADDGGSSGRLRQELGVAPPGDVRNCLVALAQRRGLAEVFNYRFERGGALSDHSVGNIIIAALSDMAGGFCEGVNQAAGLLCVKGQVFPAAVASLTLVAHYDDGTVIRGQSAIRAARKSIRRIATEPEGTTAPMGVIEAVGEADVVVLSSGSLFTSTIPAVLGGQVIEALQTFRGPVVYVANLMTQPGETEGFSASDHLRAIAHHVGPVVTDVLVHSGDLSQELIEPYRAEGAAPVIVDREEIRALGVTLREADLVSSEAGAEVRHHASKLAEEVRRVALVHL